MTFAEINSKTQMALEIETESGRYWTYGTMDELQPRIDRAVKLYGGISDLDLVWWEDQPEDIRAFHKAYDERTYRPMGMEEFYNLHYKEA